MAQGDGPAETNQPKIEVLKVALARTGTNARRRPRNSGRYTHQKNSMLHLRDEKDAGT
jgi:hypothetical protein